MGLERLASVLQQVPTNYDTDLFTPIHARMRELLGHDPDAFEQERFSYQVIADHSRAIDVPRRRRRAAVQRGPRLRPAADPAPRRAPRPAARADASRSSPRPPTVVIDTMGDAYPYLRERRDAILGAIAREERQFAGRSTPAPSQLEEALIPLTSAERVVGRRAEDLPADAPVLPGESRSGCTTPTASRST